MTVLTLFVFSVVVWLNRGHYDPTAPLLTLIFLIWNASVFFNWTEPGLFQKSLRWIPWIWGGLFFLKNDLLYVSKELKLEIFWIRSLPLVGVLFCSVFKRSGKWLGPALISLSFALTLYYSPSPHIDVFHSNRLAVQFFLKGLNPYSEIYPDIYEHSYDYHPGFLYWPGALLLQTLSQVLFHDIRAVLILAWVFASFFLPNRKHSILLWITIPFLAFAFEQAWLDPLIIFGAAIALYAIEKEKLFLWALAVVISASVKQYGFMIGLFSMLYLMLEKGASRLIRPVIGVFFGFALVMLPFLLWSPQDFLNQTVFNHVGAQVRPDALNFTAFWLRLTGDTLSPITQLIAVIFGCMVATVHVLKNRSRRGVRVIPEAWAIFFGFSVLFGKFAFCNYYCLMLGFWLLAEIWGADRPGSELEVLRENIGAHQAHKQHSFES
jgi:uncharacterized membrane protein